MSTTGLRLPEILLVRQYPYEYDAWLTRRERADPGDPRYQGVLPAEWQTFSDYIQNTLGQDALDRES